MWLLRDGLVGPALILPAALAGLWITRRRRRLAVGLACTAGAGIVLGMGRVPRDEAVLRANIGDMLFDAGHPEAVLTEYRAVLKASPDAWRIDIKVANALIALGRPGEALAALGRVIDHLHAEAQRTGLPSAEELVYCHELAGDLEAASGRLDAAAAHYEAALEVAPPAAQPRLRAKLAACRRSTG